MDNIIILQNNGIGSRKIIRKEYITIIYKLIELMTQLNIIEKQIEHFGESVK